MAKDRVIAVDGVSKSNANRAWRSSCTCLRAQSASAAADRALAGQGAKKAPPPQPPQENSYSFTGLFWDTRR